MCNNNRLKSNPPGTDVPISTLSIELICRIAEQQYGTVNPRLPELFADLKALYAGRWPRYESCQVGYHNLNHCLDVALAVARMSAGHNKVAPGAPIGQGPFLAGMAAALFHDAGYIKDRGDNAGRGGKYTFNHVARSIRLTRGYLREKGWRPEDIELIGRLILSTNFHTTHGPVGLFQDRQEEILGGMVATADLVAQMADVDYLRRINDLFEEFQEAYRFEGTDALAANGVRIYSSAREILDGTLCFYEDLVLPRLEGLGRMDRYLAAYFGDGRNPYQENIVANLSGQLFYNRNHWQRLGEVLERLGIIAVDQVERAIGLQSQRQGQRGSRESGAFKKSQLMTWMNQRQSSHRLGEILMNDLAVIDSRELCHGLLTQALPPELEKTMSRADLLFLLRAAVLLQNYNRGSQVFDNLLAMTESYLDCEASCIRLVDQGSGEMFAAVPAAAAPGTPELPSHHIDKGLAGWAYRHGRPVSINNVAQDARFFFDAAAPDTQRLRSILAVPFHIDGERVGVLELLNKKEKSFSEHDTELVTCLLNIIGTVLGNMLMDGREKTP